MQLTRSPGAAPQHHRRTPAARLAGTFVGLLVVASALAAAAVGAGTASATDAAPHALSGDHQSPRVAQLAGEALDLQATYDRTHRDADFDRFHDALFATAAATAEELGVDESRVQRAWDRADDIHQVAVLAALTQLGVEYQSNTSEEGVGFDCSGLTFYAWAEAGVALSRPSGAQIAEAVERSAETAMAGDLVQYPGHVMMYLGVPGAVVHASNPENDVELWLLSDQSVRYGDPTD